MNTNTNNTGTTNSTNGANTGSQGGSDIGGLNSSVRQILGQQAELLAKIELLLENQARLELALVANAAITTINGGQNQQSASV